MDFGIFELGLVLEFHAPTFDRSYLRWWVVLRRLGKRGGMVEVLLMLRF